MQHHDKQLLDRVVAITKLAGDAIMSIYESGEFEVMHKADESPVTAADLAADKVIQEQLLQLTPDIPVLSEENADITFAKRQTWTRYWLIDPLDGTKEFIKRNGEFTVNIALIDQHRPVLGVVYCPTTNEAYAGLNTGDTHAFAFREVGEERQAINVSSVSQTSARLVVSRNNPPDIPQLLAALPNHQIVSRGSSLKFCLLAEGKADIYPRLHPCCEWDTGAGQAVLEAAGGALLTLQGEALSYNRKDSYLNPYFVALGNTTEAWWELL